MSITKQLEIILSDLQDAFPLDQTHILVIGCSTSEVAGEHIGTAGTLETAEEIFSTLQAFQKKTHVHLAFQCCEHLNRALVITRETLLKYGLEPVTVVPVRHAGGALASVAYQNMHDAVIVETIRADAGIDIGDTFIGMHLKPVAVPIRSAIREIGHAHVTLAMTRPKLIGGNRAIYE